MMRDSHTTLINENDLQGQLTASRKYSCQHVLWKPIHENSPRKHHILKRRIACHGSITNTMNIENASSYISIKGNLGHRLQKLENQQLHWKPNCNNTKKHKPSGDITAFFFFFFRGGISVLKRMLHCSASLS